jgi:short-subunit dehydrogenase
MTSESHAGAPGKAIVTGAAGGLGSAFVEALRARGYEVIGADLAGADAILDVTDADACRRLAQDVQPNVWVNNAGILGAGIVADQGDDEIERIVGVNLLGVIHGTRAAVDVMRQRGYGKVLNVASLASFSPVPGETVYAATKHAVRAFTMGMAAELRGSGIRLMVLCPDGIWTPMLYDRLEDPAAALSFSGTKLLEPGAVAEVGVELIESGRHRPLASIPRWRGALARGFGISPNLFLRAMPLFERAGRRNQARLLKSKPKTE